MGTFDFVAIMALKSPHTLVLPTLRRKAWMHSFRFKRIQNMEFLVLHVLGEVLVQGDF